MNSEMVLVSPNKTAYHSGVGGAPAEEENSHARIKLQLTLLTTASIGLALAFLNSSWPVVRNATEYMKQSLEIIARHYDLYSVVHDPAWTGGKPILFSLIATPLVRIFGANSGLVATSALGTLLFLFTAMLALKRLNKKLGISQQVAPLELLFVAFNPLVMYQFWSAYPDSLFSGLVLAAFICIDEIASFPERDTRWHIVALGVVIILAVYTKLYGVTLLLSCSAYVVFNAKRLRNDSILWKSKLTIAVAASGFIGIVLISAFVGKNPILILDANSGFSDYMSGIRHLYVDDIRGALVMLGFTLLLSFQFSLLLAFKAKTWKWSAAAPAAFFLIYMLGLLPSYGTGYNMRYFIPTFPLSAAILASGYQAISKAARKTILGLFIVVACSLILNFNVAFISEIARPVSTRLFGDLSKPAGLLDNLRLPVHMAIKKQIDTVNREVPSNSLLYWSSDYYGIATHGLSHYLGVRRDLEVQYVLEPSYAPVSTRPAFMTVFTSTEPPELLWRGPRWARPVALGHGLFRLDPISVQLTSTSGDYVSLGSDVRLRANVLAGGSIRVDSVEFFDGDQKIYSDPKSPFDATLYHPVAGRHVLTAKVKFATLDNAVSNDVVLYVGVPAMERAASDTNDLMFEFRDFTMIAPQQVIPFMTDANMVGIRFDDIILNRSQPIAEARIRLTAAAAQLEETMLDVCAEISPNPIGFTLDSGSLSRRHCTRSHIKWKLGPWKAADDPAWSPNLSSVLKEVVEQPAWRPGDAVMLLIRVSGAKRLVRAVDHGGFGTPALYIRLQR